MEKERSKEAALSRESVLEQFARFGGEGARETRAKQDAEGRITVLEVRINGEKPGDFTELAYTREGVHDKDAAAVSTIQALYYEDDMPTSGKTLANFIDGQWVPA